MAGWLVRLPLALLLAVVVHGIALWVVAQEMQSLGSVIQRKADPMFTRQITQPLAQAAPSAVVPPLAEGLKQPAKPKNRAQAAIKTIAEKPAEPALPEPTPEPIPDKPLPSVTAVVTPTAPTLATPSAPEPSAVVDASATLAAATATLPAIATETSALASVPSGTVSGQATDTLVTLGNWPIDTRLTYDLGGYYRGELFGDATVQWTRDGAAQGEGYQVRIDLSVGPIKALLTSQGKVSAYGLLPQAYEEQWGGRQSSVRLDEGAVLLTNGKRVPRPVRVAARPDDAAMVQDTASQFVELGHRFANGRAKLAAGEIVQVWLARPGGLYDWVYDVGPAETLYLPLIGPVQAFHLTPRPQANPRGSMVAEMWFAPSLQYLPVRIKLTLDKDAHLDLKVRKIEQR